MILTGIMDIDSQLHCAPGELWLHYGSPGELFRFCGVASTNSNCYRVSLVPPIATTVDPNQILVTGLISAKDLRSHCERLSSLRAVFVDSVWLKLDRNPFGVDGARRKQIRDLKMMALDLDVPVFFQRDASLQAYVDATKAKGRYTLASLPDWKEAEKSADIVTCSWTSSPIFPNIPHSPTAVFTCVKHKDQALPNVCYVGNQTLGA